MVRTFYQEDIINLLASLFTYGLNEGYSCRAIEERIASSHFICSLENNEYDIESKIENIVELTYNVSLNSKEVDISFKGLFIADSYFKLFLYFNKSFEYLFLYWPLEFFVEHYNVYHEMDFSNLKIDFMSKIKETTLLKKLALNRQIKLVDISKLTGINKNTIDRYSRDDAFLYKASYDTIYKLALLFNVKTNIFASNLAIYLDQSIYLFDKRYSDLCNYMGFYYASFYDNRINKTEFTYDKNSCFKSKEGTRLIVLPVVLNNETFDKLNKLSDPKTYVVIIPLGFFGNESTFTNFKKINAIDVFVLTQEYVYIVQKKIKREITDTINRSLIIKANEKISSLSKL